MPNDTEVSASAAPRARIVLGVTGGIASYKAVWLARLLTQRGIDVDVVMTRGAQEFVGPITFEAVTGRRVYTEVFGAGNALDHIRLGRGARAVLVAPATADFIARAVQGRADDLLTAILLATDAPVILAPAMNDRMWAHAQTQVNVTHARSIGYAVIEPAVGPLAVGEGSGPGRLPEPEVILAEVERVVAGRTPLQGKRIIVTAGATREPIDPVRFISNHSSGRMGVAIAQESYRRGADVTLIAGHTDVAVPPGVRVERIETTQDMASAVGQAVASADVLIMAAAPGDYAVRHPSDRKLKKSDGVAALELIENPDILQSTATLRRPGMIVVGFALETQDLLENATAKLRTKQLDLVVANVAGEPGAGFGEETNRVTILDATGGIDALPLLSKHAVAERILDRVEALLERR